ncbi:MAG: biopolymer transporter ExbD [Nitrospirae bacterium]|nr:biopolymer transporter ExbD [Nitrospirota bacterium]
MEEKEFNYINVIPLVDVMLVLLTIVLTTSAFIAAGVIPVELPRASKNQAEILKTQTIEITRQGQVYLNAQPVSIEGLKEFMQPLGRDIPILIRADRTLALQLFVDVIAVVKNLGFKKVSLQTEEKR